MELNIGGVLRRLRIDERHLTLAELSYELDNAIGAAALQRMETRNTTIDIGNLQILASFYRVTVTDLIREAEGGEPVDPALLQAQRVPVLQWDEIGPWQAPENRSALRQNRATVLAPPPATESCYALTVSGDSMQSERGTSFPEGYTILVDPLRAPMEGDFIVALTPEGRSTFKQLVSDGLDQYLRPLNRSYSQTPLAEAKICGVVIESRWNLH
ncbi:LexA family protein (plasmid) [Microbulbifer sp. ANSA001]|uniref:LexA family protein n=1 Tax=Microbulbifer sp. ANSA001 TaxID=3243358 RepID=UPI004041D0F1